MMSTYCDVQKIKPICLAVPELCENSCNVQSRKLKQQNRSPTEHFRFSLPSVNNCRISLAKFSFGNLESCSYDVLPTWVKYCPIITNSHLPYVFQDRTLYSKCSQFTLTKNAYSPSQQKVSSHSHGIRKIVSRWRV